ncbi:MAG: hypothetical protein ACRDE5_15215, partial [Ginsengibacter sp.]
SSFYRKILSPHFRGNDITATGNHSKIYTLQKISLVLRTHFLHELHEFCFLIAIGITDKPINFYS